MGVSLEPSRLRFLAAFIVAAALIFAHGCGPSHEGTDTVLRFIEKDPEELFDAGRLYRQHPVFAWDFSSSEAVAAWQARGIDEVKPENGALVLRSSTPNLELLRSTDFAAEDVTTIEIRVQGLIAGRVVLQWAGAGEALGPERRIVMRSPNPDPEAIQSYRFHVGGHAGWRGRIQRVRIRIAAPPLRPVALHAVRGSFEVLQAGHLAEAVDRPWKVELDEEVRNVLLAVPGREIRRQLVVPSEGRLRLAWGTPSDTLVPVRFQVALARPGASPRILYEALSEPGSGGWNDVDLDLRPWEGERVELVLSSSARGPLEPWRGLPVWANPEVLGSAGRDLPLNVVLISVDTLRADRLSLYGYARPTSPHLDAWARRRGTVFRSVVASSPWTLPSHVSLFTGLDSLRHGVNHSVPAPGSLNTLAEQLRRAGYKTLAITGGAFLRPELGLSQGFDVYRYWSSRAHFETELSSGIERALDWIARHQHRPFFLFFHTYAVHSPYLSRQPYLRRLSGRNTPDRTLAIAEQLLDGEPGAPTRYALGIHAGGLPAGADPAQDEIIRIASDLYDSGVAYADAELKRLLERLEQPDLAGRTIVVLTSDHGEMFGEHGLVSHTSLYDQNLLVPLILAGAGRRPAVREIRDQVRQIDVAPTILELAGLTVPSGIDGVSLVPLLEGNRSRLPGEAWSYAGKTKRGVSVRARGRIKYIFNNTGLQPFAGREELYRLEEDPGELRDMAAGAAELEALRRRSRQRLESFAPGLRIELASSSGAPVIHGTISGAAVQEDRVKSWDLSCRCLEIEREGVARFTLPPGNRFTLLFEAVESGVLQLDLRAGDRGPELTTTFSLRDLRGEESLVLDGGNWRRQAGKGGSPAARVSLWWHRDAPVDPPSAVAKELLLKDLRALGYVR